MTIENVDRATDQGDNGDDIAKYIPMMDAAIATGIRIWFNAQFQVTLDFAMMIHLYDKGFRAGDFVMLRAGGLNSLNELKTIDYAKYEKVREFFSGSINFY
jgi:hypothetical protein